MFTYLLYLLREFTEIFLLFSSYITNTSSFPNPLTKEEEEYYLKLYSQGDEKARNILVERNLRLVAHIVKKYYNTGYDIDDLISIGTIGLIKAISTFDMEKGTRLATYAARCIENAIVTLWKHFYCFFLESAPNRTISMSSPSQIILSTTDLIKFLFWITSAVSIMVANLVIISSIISISFSFR
ncbi:RNA polymerase sporulation-specific sigma factor [Keratinibaculum paraultunense]|uniref:RNA polymerase sporulation-specific sigma factor n=1 Tax=Keratinibaculum paraultunense TaxID=1278232 RepID=A0A4R3L013_9FIRM|nr:sigma-70 family RNA polymerase sigma factor [Keratinibaculum paraultunense]TCS91302.1 RNA polymerase sporulation-specific sigma factor [Keratinibaculum paraultunense]